MRILFLVFALFTVAGTINAQTQTIGWLPAGIDLHNYSDPFDGKWKMVFEDDFNTTSTTFLWINGVYTALDHRPTSTKWEVTNSGFDPHPPTISCSRNTANNVWVANGICSLGMTKEATPIIEDGRAFPYTSGNIELKIDGNTTYFERGMFEARIKMSNAYYQHSNMMLFADMQSTKQLKGEIDICENDGNNTKEIYRDLHVFYNGNDIPVPRSPNCPGGIICPNANLPVSKNQHFLIYTAIWDKYFIHMYVNHVYAYTFPRLYLHAGPIPSFYLGTHTIAGNYSIAPYFFPFNEGGNLTLGLYMNRKGAMPYPFNLWIQDFNIDSKMEIDWVRVYKRDVCTDDEVITNSDLFPFGQLDEKTITLGTQSDLPWTNIVRYWGTDSYYSGEAITLLPNFEATAVASPSGNMSYTTFTARECPETTNEYIYPEELGYEYSEPPVEDEGFNCNGLDSLYIDSIMNNLIVVEDSVKDIIINFLDSVDCNYWSGEHKGGVTELVNTVFNRNQVTISPNPNTGQFTLSFRDKGSYNIKIMSVTGQVVFNGEYKDKARIEILLPDIIPSGVYFVYIDNKQMTLVRKISIQR